MPSASELRAAATEKVRPSVVRIETGGWTGTGFVYKTAKNGSEAYIVTAAHVVEGQYQAKVTTHDRFTVDAVILGADEASDLAVIRACCASFKAGSFGNVGQLRVGEEVMGLGYALGYEGAATLTTGIASWIGSESGVHMVQTDAPLNPGNSGGPLFSQRGVVVGIVSSSATDAEGIAFAVSEKTIRETLPHLENVPPRQKPRLTPTPTRAPVSGNYGEWTYFGPDCPGAYTNCAPFPSDNTFITNDGKYSINPALFVRCPTGGNVEIMLATEGTTFPESAEVRGGVLMDIGGEEITVMADAKGWDEDLVWFGYRDSMRMISQFYVAETAGIEMLFGAVDLSEEDRDSIGGFNMEGFTTNYWRLTCAE